MVLEVDCGATMEVYGLRHVFKIQVLDIHGGRVSGLFSVSLLSGDVCSGYDVMCVTMRSMMIGGG